MRNPTRLAFNGYLAHQAKLNGVPSASEKFAASPSVQQTMETRIQESSEFLQRINVMGVTEQTGEGTRTTAQQVRELSHMAEELRQSVSRFKIA